MSTLYQNNEMHATRIRGYLLSNAGGAGLCLLSICGFLSTGVMSLLFSTSVADSLRLGVVREGEEERVEVVVLMAVR